MGYWEQTWVLGTVGMGYWGQTWVLGTVNMGTVDGKHETLGTTSTRNGASYPELVVCFIKTYRNKNSE